MGNETPFDPSSGGESDQMAFLNEFIVKIKPDMRKFFDQLCVWLSFVVFCFFKLCFNSHPLILFPQDVRTCMTLPMSPFTSDVALREEACRVFRHHMANAREWFRSKCVYDHHHHHHRPHLFLF